MENEKLFAVEIHLTLVTTLSRDELSKAVEHATNTLCTTLENEKVDVSYAMKVSL